jgi:hypothetical protein
MAEVTTTVDSGTGVRTNVVKGKLTADDLLRALAEIYGMPDYDPAANALWDLRGADGHDLSTQDIRRIAGLVAEHRRTPPGMCTALVVGSTLDFGLARMFEQMLASSAAGITVMVFRDMIEAKAWLSTACKKERPCP